MENLKEGLFLWAMDLQLMIQALGTTTMELI